MAITCVLFLLGTPPVTGEILPSQQPEQLPIVQANEIFNSVQVKEEQEDHCIIPPQTDDVPEDVKVRLTESETMSQTQSQPDPTLSTMTMNDDKEDDDEDMEDMEEEDDDEDEEDEWKLSSSCGQDHDYTSYLGPDHAPKHEKACRFCGTQFFRYCDLVKHVENMHMGEKAFKCPECDKEFARRDYLGVHSRVHTGEKPYECPYCKKLFAQSSNLYVHLRQHTGEKPYFCKSCGKMVAHSSHLKICGAREPKVKKKFRCLVCGKKFHTVSNLQEHINVHDARKPNTVVRPFLLIFPQPISNVGIDSLVSQKKNNDSCC